MRKKFNWPSPIEAEMHLTTELNRGGIHYLDGGRKNVKICCPFSHENGLDTKYKLEITRTGRKAHCWVCDWSGSWNKLADHLGLDPFGKAAFEYETYTDKAKNANFFGHMLSDLEGAVESEDTKKLPSNLSKWGRDEPWRGFDPSFLSAVSSFRWKQSTKEGVVERILWPYYQYGTLVGYVGRRLDSVDDTKYYRAPWAKALSILFPFDYVVDHFSAHPSIVLVEGEVDALRLLSAGIPALSILGSNNWEGVKRDLLIGMNKKNVFILMDGDFAGRKAASVVHDSLKNCMNAKKLTLSEGEDPGDMSEEQLEWLRNKVS